MLILGIETSCDETGIALYDGVENKIIFESLFSQADKHSLYGGVVPELAARDHTNKLLPLLKKEISSRILNIIIKLKKIKLIVRNLLIKLLIIYFSYYI